MGKIRFRFGREAAALVFNFSFKFIVRREGLSLQFALDKTYRVVSSASVDVLWQKLMNLADVSWHPLLASTNAPLGLVPKPGLIYQVVTRILPIPVRIFVERVSPMELLSFRVIALPGVENLVTYRVESAVCGSCISCSITLRGWLSPLLWWLIQPYMKQVAAQLAQAAEQIAAL